MTKELKMLVGVALLATLALAGALGIFTFSAAQPVGAQTVSTDVIRGFGEPQVANDGTVTVDVKITVSNVDSLAITSVTETLPAGWEYELKSAVDGKGLDAEPKTGNTGNQQTVSFDIIGLSSVTYTVSAPDMAESGTFSGMATIAQFGSDDIMGSVGGDTTVTVGTATNGGNGEPTGGNGDPEAGITLSSTTAGAAVQVVIKASADTAKTSATDITVNLAKFGVPSTISEGSIIIEDGPPADDTRAYVGEPGSIVVSGTKVTLSLFSRFPGAASAAGTLTGAYTITFKQSAGITNPPVAGTATVTVSDGDDDSHSLKETIQSAVSLSKGSGARGTDVTVEGVGLGAGGATVYLVNGACADQGDLAKDEPCTEEDDISLGTGNVSGGKVEVDIETSSSDFEAGVDQIDKKGVKITSRTTYFPTDSLRGRNQITIVDGTGKIADKPDYFTLTPTIGVDEDAVQQGDELTIIVEDWYYGGIASVTIGDESAVIEDRGGFTGDFEIDIIVPPSARLGEQELKVTGSMRDREGSLTANKADVAKGSVIVGALAIELEPSSFVLGQQFTINVKGFSTDDPVRVDGDVPDDIKLVKVGNYLLKETTAGVGVERLSIDTNGFFTNTFRLNSNDQYLKPGGYRVQVEDHSGRVALGRITIPEPTITVDPSISRRGTTVSIAGENFPAGRVVQIYYRDTEDENQQGAVLADSAGRISISFTVPSDAEIGEEQDVTATSAAKETDYKAKATHSLPPQEITVTPMQVAPGGRLTIEGHNMPLYTLVGLKIADISVAGTGAETNDLGSFVKEDVLVPQLKPGTHTVEASVATQGAEAAKVRTTIEIVEALTTGAPADVFDPLGDRLVRVWYLERATQVWSFYDPDPDVAAFNTLTEVSSGQNVSIIISSGESVEFQVITLYPGTNPIALK